MGISASYFSEQLSFTWSTYKGKGVLSGPNAKGKNLTK